METGDAHTVACYQHIHNGISCSEEIAMMSLKFLIAEISFEIGPVPREKLRLHYRPSHGYTARVWLGVSRGRRSGHSTGQAIATTEAWGHTYSKCEVKPVGVNFLPGG